MHDMNGSCKSIYEEMEPIWIRMVKQNLFSLSQCSWGNPINSLVAQVVKHLLYTKTNQESIIACSANG